MIFLHRTKDRLIGGYSLIELVVYLALFTGISILLINALVTCMRTYDQAATYRRLQSNGELVMERVVRELRQATSITTGSSTFGTNPGTLTLVGTDASSVAHTIVFSVASNAVQVNDNGTTGNLTTSDVTVPTLIFRRISTTNGDAVKVELTLTTAKGTTLSANFYSTILLRGK